MTAYAEAIAAATTPERHEEIAKELTAYCALDTLALVRVWEFLSGNSRAAA